MNQTTLLLTAALFALFAVLIWARRRSRARRAMDQFRERKVLALESESMFMPVAELEGAVEVVDMDALLKADVVSPRRPTVMDEPMLGRAAAVHTMGRSMPLAAAGGMSAMAAGATGASPKSSAVTMLSLIPPASGAQVVLAGEIAPAEVRLASTLPFAVTLTEDESEQIIRPDPRLALVAAGQVKAANPAPPARNGKARTVPQPPTLVGSVSPGGALQPWATMPDIDESTLPMGAALNERLGDALAAVRAHAARQAATTPVRAPVGLKRPDKSAGTDAPMPALAMNDAAAAGKRALGSEDARPGNASKLPRKVATASRGLIDAPLRELALAWFEARGYRASAASEAVLPIQLVLRHREDPSRAYAFVVQRDRVDLATASRLLEQAQSIGLLRLLIAAEGGAHADVHALMRRKGVRVLDRIVMQHEVDKLELPVAAKIIALARARARAHAPGASSRSAVRVQVGAS